MAFFSNLKISNCGQKGRIVVASRAFVYTNAILLCKMLVGKVPQTPLFCIFQCRLRVPAGHFLSDDTFRVIENLHKVRCSLLPEKHTSSVPGQTYPEV